MIMNVETTKPSCSQAVVVIGANMSGIATAINLRKRGYSVTLVDDESTVQSPLADSPRFMSIEDIVPCSKLSIFPKLNDRLLNTSDLLGSNTELRVGLWRALIVKRWLRQFIRANKPENVEFITKGLAQLSHLSAAAYQPLLLATGMASLLRTCDLLYLFDTALDIGASKREWQLRKACCLDFEFVSQADLRSMAPDIAPTIACAMRVAGWNFFSDTRQLKAHLMQYFSDLGGQVALDKILNLNLSSNKVTGITLQHNKVLETSYVVITSDTWALANTTPDVLPLTALTSYKASITNANASIKYPLLHHNTGIVLAPTKTELQVSGIFELRKSQSKLGVNFEKKVRNNNFVKRAVNNACKLLPALQTNTITTGCDLGGITPDSLPIIDYSSTIQNVIYACGHGRLDISHGAVTGKIVADMLQFGNSSKVDLSYYRLNRFK